MENSIILHNISREDLFSEISKIVNQAIETKIKPEPPKDLLTKKEVADKLHLCLRTIQRLTSDGTLPAVRIGRRLLYRSDLVDQALKKIDTIKYKRG